MEKPEFKEPEIQPAEMPNADIKPMSEVLPTMNVSTPAMPITEKEECIVSDTKLLGVYDEILDYCREDRKSIDDILGNMVNMVMNDGDSTGSTKEAMVNLIKAKSDVSDKMAKVADLMTRIKLRDRDTYKAYLHAHQHNKVTIETKTPKKDLLKNILKDAKKLGKEHNDK